MNFVGSNTGEAPGGCDVPNRDRDNEGHSGYLATHIAALRLLPRWLETSPTDIVTIHLGSNDISHGYDAETILDAMSKLVEQLRDANAEMKIIVRKFLDFETRGELKTSTGCAGSTHTCRVAGVHSVGIQFPDPTMGGFSEF